jgi:hypothetical protein
VTTLCPNRNLALNPPQWRRARIRPRHPANRPDDRSGDATPYRVSLSLEIPFRLKTLHVWSLRYIDRASGGRFENRPYSREGMSATEPVIHRAWQEAGPNTEDRRYGLGLIWEPETHLTIFNVITSNGRTVVLAVWPSAERVIAAPSASSSSRLTRVTVCTGSAKRNRTGPRFPWGS